MGGSADLILGLDGGGTKTLTAVAGRDGSIMLSGHTPSVDPFARTDWAEGLARSLAPVSSLAPRLAAAVLGLPCFGEVGETSQRQQEVAQRLLPVPHIVVNDVQAAFTGALTGRPGILLLAGTGSMAWGGDGTRELRVGGWGDVFGDEGSAYWIGRNALSEVGRALDGRSQTRAFAQDLLARLELKAEHLLAWCYSRTTDRRSAIAGLASTVDAMAEAGDAQAQSLLMRAADHLADHAFACRTGLDLPDTACWSHAGSVFRSKTVMTQVVERLGSEPAPPSLPPVGGALLTAARLCGWTVDRGWSERLRQALSFQDAAFTQESGDFS